MIFDIQRKTKLSLTQFAAIFHKPFPESHIPMYCKRHKTALLFQPSIPDINTLFQFCFFDGTQMTLIKQILAEKNNENRGNLLYLFHKCSIFSQSSHQSAGYMVFSFTDCSSSISEKIITSDSVSIAFRPLAYPFGINRISLF